jgi:Gamma-glutamyl cyclotransferase, AIG2-like
MAGRVRANLWSATRGRSVADWGRVANIVEASGGVVWGALYEIAAELVTRRDGKRSVVDRLEGHRTTNDPENYAKLCVTVDLHGEPRTARTYVGLRDAIDRCEQEHGGSTCDPAYVETVLSGARAIGVSLEYLNALPGMLAPPGVGPA